MFKPVGYAVLINPEKLQDELKQDKSSTIFIPESVQNSQRIETVIGKVISIGAQAWIDQGTGAPWCKIGDRVLYAKHGGKIFQDPDTNEDVVLIQDRDVLGIMEEGKHVRV